MKLSRLLLYTPFVNRGGVRRMTEALAERFAASAAQHGFDLAILGQTYDENGSAIAYPASVPFTQIDGGPIPLQPDTFTFLKTRSRVFVEHLRRVAADYDLIFCPNTFWSMAGEWGIDTPLVALMPDCAWDFIEMGSFLHFYFWETTYRIQERAAAAVFIGDFHRHHAEAEYGFHNAVTIHNSADLFAAPFDGGADDLARVRRRYDLPQEYLLLPHALHHHGLEVGLRAYALARSLTDLPPLVLTGYGAKALLDETPADPLTYQMRALIAELGLEDLSAPGLLERADMGALFAGAALVLVPSLMDGDLSGSAFEAIQAKSPLILSDLESFTDRLGLDERYALMFPVGDTGALAQAICRVRRDPAAAAQRAERAWAWAQTYTLTDAVAAYWRVFENVLNKERVECRETSFTKNVPTAASVADG